MRFRSGCEQCDSHYAKLWQQSPAAGIKYPFIRRRAKAGVSYWGRIYITGCFIIFGSVGYKTHTGNAIKILGGKK